MVFISPASCVARKRLTRCASRENPYVRVAKQFTDETSLYFPYIFFDKLASDILLEGVAASRVDIDPRDDFNATLL